MFVFQLAEHLHKTVGEIEEISEVELFEWQAYFRMKDDGGSSV